MSSISEKIEMFEKTIMDDATAQCEKILAEYTEKKRRLVAENKRKADREASEKIKLAERRNAEYESEKISEIEAMGKKELLNERMEIINKVFSAVLEKIENFKKTDEYPTFLKKTIMCGIADVGEGADRIYIDGTDLKYKEILEKEFGISVLADGENIIGGAKVANSVKGIMCDNSFRDKIAEEKTKFLEISGLAL